MKLKKKLLYTSINVSRQSKNLTLDFHPNVNPF